MNEETQKQLLEYVEQVGSFVSTQAPLVVQELLAYGLWESYASLFIVGIIVLVWAIVTAVLWRFDLGWTDSSYGSRPTNDGWSAVGCTVCGSLILMVGFAVSCDSVMNLIKIKTAPRVYVIEQLKGL